MSVVIGFLVTTAVAGKVQLPQTTAGTPSPFVKIVSPRGEQLVTLGGARVIVRTDKAVRRIEAMLNGNDVSAAFRADRRGVWIARLAVVSQDVVPVERDVGGGESVA